MNEWIDARCPDCNALAVNQWGFCDDCGCDVEHRMAEEMEIWNTLDHDL